MNDETPDIDQLKEEERATVQITIEEEDVAPHKASQEQADVSEALRDLGRQFAETIQSAWNSQERREFEREVREGIEHFGDEMNRVFREARESEAAQKVREEAEEVKTKVETKEFSRKARASLVDGLTWLSQEMAKLAEQFSPTEKQPEDVEPDVTEEA